MKKHLKETIIILLQLFIFYIFPNFAGPTDIMGMVFIIMAGTFILAILFALISQLRLLFIYPLIISILFIPSVFIYYNSSALIHSLWYFFISLTGFLIGSSFSKFIK